MRRREFLRSAGVGAATATIAVALPRIIEAATSYPVSSAADLQSALNANRPDITLTASITIPSDGIRWPNATDITLRANPGVVITYAGTDGPGLLGCTSPAGKTVRFYNVTIDGGWQSYQSESDVDGQPADFSGYNYVELIGCIIRNCRRAGFYCTNNKKVFISNCTFSKICRDGTWANNTVDFTVQDSVFEYCRDDAGSCHVDPGRSITGRRVRFLRNQLFQTFEAKFLGGGDVLVEGNYFDLMGPAGVYFGIDPTTGEGARQVQTGYVVRNNVFRNLMDTAMLSWSGDIQTAVQLYAPGKNTGILVERNRFEIMPDGGKYVSDLYPTRTQGLFDKDGWIDERIYPGDRAIRIFSRNARSTTANIVRNNTFIGAWNATPQRIVE